MASLLQASSHCRVELKPSSTAPSLILVNALNVLMGLVTFTDASHISLFTDLLRGKHKKFEFLIAVRAAFKSLKEAIANIASVTHHDPTTPLSLSTDASDVSGSAVLQQRVGDTWQSLAFSSKRIQPTEHRYSHIPAIRHFQQLLEGRSFTVVTELTFSARLPIDTFLEVRATLTISLSLRP
ncbi:unnamed protein product, partial [Dicrocoelium dendriticum]